MSQTVLVLRGIPASGKSSFARQWLSQDPYNRARVNRDDIRMATFGRYELPPELESVVTKIEHATIKALLASGKSVVVDNTNLRAKYLKPYLQMAHDANVTVLHKDFPIELKEALARNSARERVVPENVIKRMHDSFVRKGSFGTFPVLEQDNAGLIPYVADVTKPSAYIFDIDGTLALMHDRGPFEWTKVLNDLPNPAVVLMAQMLHSQGHEILVTSGRDSVCRDDTKVWLEANDVPYDKLFMRPEGDMTKDTVVKLDIFNQEIRDKYNILGVFDDRLMVAKLWHSLDLPLFRVGDPEANF